MIRGLCAQLPEWFREDDFVAVPCCSPTCRSATYALYDGEDLVRCRGSSTSTATSASSPTARCPTLRWPTRLSGLFGLGRGWDQRTGERLECVACGVGLPDELQQIAARGFMVVDRTSRTSGRSTSASCASAASAEIVPDGRIIPFCAYNAAGYRAQVRADLAAGATA